MQAIGFRFFVFFFQAEDGIRDGRVTGVQTCALPISPLSVADATIFGVCISVKSRVVKIERKADIAPAESRKIARLSRCRFVIAALSSSVLIFAVILRLFNETGGISVIGVITSI